MELVGTWGYEIIVQIQQIDIQVVGKTQQTVQMDKKLRAKRKMLKHEGKIQDGKSVWSVQNFN